MRLWVYSYSFPDDKWYKKSESGGSYHNDDGEGLDNFHVGISRGCGGTAIHNDGNFIYSKNYSEWQILANGPLLTIFRLKYEPVMVNGKPVTETKTFTIDAGDNFYRCDVEFESEISIDTLAVGLTLHENTGQTNYSQNGWISYREPIQDSEIGMGVWVDNNTILCCEKIVNGGKDLNHIWLYAAVTKNRCNYYSGFGWKKAGQFDDEESWKEYIKKQVI
ncbi:MAG: DUF4861 family protein [Bacteroidetes bacterium]|nr:DUF4861 family protein [Bacteroidota bacterium]